MGGGRIRELEYRYNGTALAIVRDPNNAMDIGEWSICGGGQLEGLYCTCIHVSVGGGLSQNAISANLKIEFAISMPSSKIMFWKRALYKSEHINTHIHM